MSIGVGREDRARVTFQGGADPCIRNTTFRSLAPGIVTVVNRSVSTSGATLVLKGVARGETTIVAECNGKVLGWLHVACYPVKTLKIAVRLIHSAYSESAALAEGAVAAARAIAAGQSPAQVAIAVATAAAKARAAGRGGYKSTNVPTRSLRRYFRQTYRSAVLRIKIVRLPAKTVAFDTRAPTGLNIQPPGTTSIDYTEMDAIIAAARDTKYDYNLFIVDNAVYNGRLGGIARNIPDKYAFVFVKITGLADLVTPTRTAAHEIGHCMGLRHPHTDGQCTAPPHLKGESWGTALDAKNLMTSSTNTLANLKDNALRLYQWKVLRP